ncbi:MAG: hypothetical protein ACRY3E_02985 [Candidatus Lariskella arthropodorum]
MRFGRSVDFPYATKQFQADLIAAFKATSSPLQFQAGTEIGDKISASISGFDYSKLFADKDFNVQTAVNAERLAEVMDEIIAKAITVNAEIGAAMNKFNYDPAVDFLGLNSTLFSTDHVFAVADDWHLI